MTITQEPKTLQEAIVHFANQDNCIAYLVERRWRDGVVKCPTCGSDQVKYLAKRRVWQCRNRHAKCQFSIKVGTIMEDSPISLDKWLMAMWMIANCRNGVSSHEIARSLGVTQKSTWHMLHRIREAMRVEHQEPMGWVPTDPIEVDETFIGGKPKNMHASRRAAIGQSDHKVAVFGMLSRQTREVRAQVVPNVRRDTLQHAILKNIGQSSTIYSDQHVGYEGLNKMNRFTHKTVNHTMEYVNGKVHTQGIENFWSLLKRSLYGTYVAVEPFHLDRYVDEQVFRYNGRKGKASDANRLSKLVGQVVGRRLTWAELTGKDTAETPAAQF